MPPSPNLYRCLTCFYSWAGRRARTSQKQCPSCRRGVVAKEENWQESCALAKKGGLKEFIRSIELLAQTTGYTDIPIETIKALGEYGTTDEIHLV